MAVLAPNVRGSSGCGKTCVNLDHGALRAHALKDSNASVDCVVTAGVADPRRIGIMGGASGG
jgi:dipeptidyl aminopeptidase/acylaminoacyl peptidase